MLVSDAGRLDLPRVDGLRQHLPTGVNSDGTVVVGHAHGDGGMRALIWRCR